MVNSIVNKQMDNCCGVYFLHNFFKNDPPYSLASFGTTEEQRRRNYPGQTVNQAWVDECNKRNGRETRQEYLDRIRTTLERNIADFKNKKSYFLAILNEIEAREIESILLDVGFEILVPMTKNPTGSAIVMYIYHLLPRPIEKKVVKSVIPRKAS